MMFWSVMGGVYRLSNKMVTGVKNSYLLATW